MDRERELRARMQMDESDPFWAHTLGVYLAGQQRWSEAEQAFKEALRRSPTYYATYYQLGLLYENLGREPEAIEAFREGHRLAMEARDLRLLSDFRMKLSLYLGMDEA
ncbi:MAG: tetratricopeptide repeat protein [Bacteroidia bacterium]|nr:tetratricopeptide repeat protein [Bacteroidia bacterium]